MRLEKPDLFAGIAGPPPPHPPTPCGIGGEWRDEGERVMLVTVIIRLHTLTLSGYGNKLTARYTHTEWLRKQTDISIHSH